MEKSEIALLFEQLEAEGRITTLSDEESLKLMQNLNKGMKEFREKQMIKNQKTLKEIKTIILD